MNYQAIYNRLIDRARHRVPQGYVERHHIIPRCMGGEDTNDNLVALYPEEHFVAHALLLKIYKDTEHRHALAKAVQKMTVGHDGKRSKRKLYGWLKREFSLAQSISQSGVGNSQYGSFWICNDVLQESKKLPIESMIPRGWRKGRIFKNSFPVSKMKGKPRVFKSDESRQNFSDAQRRKVMPESAKEKIRQANIGKRHSEETKQKISKSLLSSTG